MAVMKAKKNTRVPRKRQHSRIVENVVNKFQAAPIKKVKKRKALVIAQEIKFARLLANNDKKVRDKMLKNLKKWLTVRSESSFAFTEADFMRLWKGLFYCMWMSDKPLIQEELAESLSNIVHCFESIDTALLYTKCTLKTLAIEWFGIDQFRLDKFQMLVRRVMRQTFEMCRRRSWELEWTKGVGKIIEETLLDAKTTLGFSLHITELYMEELAKIGSGKIPPNLVTELLRPFAIHLAAMEDERQIRHVMKHIFRYLIFQSDVGMDYMEKFEAWRQAGFPCRSIDAMQKVELSDDDDSEAGDESENTASDDEEEGPQVSKALDPRAGRVDVELPQLPFDPLEIAELIKEYKFHPKSTAKTRRQIMRLIREFSELAKGNMPLGVKEVAMPNAKPAETNPKKAAYRLLQFEKELYSDTIRRKRKRKQAAPLVGDNEGFENLLTPIDPNEFEENGFLDDDESPNVNRGSDDDDDDDDDDESKKAETFHISDKKSNKKTNIKSLQSNGVSGNKTSKKISHKKAKKQKFLEKQNDADESSVTMLKVKPKKLKAKKLQNVINVLSQKLLKRSSENGAPVKAKKSRPSIDNAWDVSSNVDTPTPTASPKSKGPKTHVAKSTQAKQSSEMKTKQASKSPTKEQINKIPWLHPVITKLEDQKKLQTPPKSQPAETQSGGSSTKKRVKIVLQRNTAQLTSEHIRQLRQSPGIPYDPNRKPLAGVLKPSHLSSPVNPFYKQT